MEEEEEEEEEGSEGGAEDGAGGAKPRGSFGTLRASSLVTAESDTLFPMSPDRPSSFSSRVGDPGQPPGGLRRGSSSTEGGNSQHGAPPGDASGHGGDEYFKSLLGRSVPRSGGSFHGGRAFARSPSSRALAALAAGAAGRKGASVHGGEYWRVLRAASELAAMGSGHGQYHYLRTAPRNEEEREEQRKAARLSLDTSAHGGQEYGDLLRRLETAREQELQHKKSSLRASASTGNLQRGPFSSSPPKRPANWPPPLAPVAEGGASQAEGGGGVAGMGGQGVPPGAGGESGSGRGRGFRGFPPPEAAAAPAPVLSEEEGGRRGRGGGAYKALLEAAGRSLPPAATQALPAEQQQQQQQQEERRQRQEEDEGRAPQTQQRQQAEQQQQQQQREGMGWPGLPPRGPAKPAAAAAPQQAQQPQHTPQAGRSKRVSFGGAVEREQEKPPAGAPAAPAEAAAEPMAVGGGTEGAGDHHKGPITNPQELESLMRQLKFKKDQGLSAEALATGLQGLGYDLTPSEVKILINELDSNEDGQVQPHEFIASQLDWTTLQQSNRELWLECARRAFASLDANSDGRLSLDAVLATLRSKLPADEVDYAVEDALVEAGYADADEMDFEGFLRMVQVGSLDSLDSLDQYDPRLRTAGMVGEDMSRLESVPEDPSGGSPRAR
ncbi:hypothetical protein N2152v2_000486 [Parachlorella kessleri]